MKSSSNTNLVRKYCRNHKTTGKTLHMVYQEFCEASGFMDREQFELILLSLNSRAAKSTRDRCLAYPADQYQKFIKEQEYVTEGFWESAHSERTILLESSEGVGAITQMGGADTRCYQNLLPENWEKMTNPQRIDFTKKVHHEGFRDYIFSIDPKVAKFFREMRKKSPNTMAVYVTLFSFPAENYSNEAQGLLKTFVNTLNDLGRSRLQYVECNEPHVIEIREIRS